METDTQLNVGFEGGFSSGQRGCIFPFIEKEAPDLKGLSDKDMPYHHRLC